MKIIYNLFILIFISIFFTGCISTQKSFSASDEKIYTEYKKIKNKPSDTHTLYLDYYLDEERNKILNLMRLGLFSYQNGYNKDAELAFDNILTHIESLNMNDSMTDKAKSLWSGEDAKLFVGEPYERAMAYYYRGLLYLKNADYENARASFRGGILQDSKSENTEYQADFKSLFLLEALSSKLNQNEDLFEEMLLEYNNITSQVNHIYPDFNYPEFDDEFIYTKKEPIRPTLLDIEDMYNKKFDENYSVKSTSSVLSIICEAYGRDYKITPARKVETCGGERKENFYQEITEKESLTLDELIKKYAVSQTTSKEKFNQFKEAKLSKYDSQLLSYNKEKEIIKEKSKKIIEKAFEQYHKDKELSLKKYLADKKEFFEKKDIRQNNVFIIIDTGIAPKKLTGGTKDSELYFEQSSPLISPNIKVNGKVKDVSLLDDIYFQATTRGGRGIDKIIEGKVAWKDEASENAQNIKAFGAGSWEVSKGLLENYESSGSPEADAIMGGAILLFAAVAGAAALVGEATQGVANSVITKADDRYWNNLPGGIYLYMDKLLPGKHEVNIEDKTINIQIEDENTYIHHITLNNEKPMGFINDDMILNIINNKEGKK